MARKSYTTEQIIGHLRQGEVLLSQGKTMESMLREIGVGQPPFWSPPSIGTFRPECRAAAA